MLGKPEGSGDFEEFAVEDVSIFIDKNILGEYLKDNVLYINIEGSGKYPFEIIDGE